MATLTRWGKCTQERRRIKRKVFLWTALGLTVWLAVLAYAVPDSVRESTWLGRKLLSGGGTCNKSDHATWMRNGGVALYFVGTLYLFLGIAIICDDFFVSSLETISTKLNLSEDVAGATFMAAGSSAPELFSSLVSLTNDNASNEIGIGTIVGSAVFNILVIIGVTAIFAGRTLYLDWKPLLRDVVFYSAAIFSIIFIFANEKVHWWEGLLSVAAYGSYILFMKYNSRIMKWMDDKMSNVSCLNRHKRSNRVVSEDGQGNNTKGNPEGVQLANQDGITTPSNVDVQGKKGGLTPNDASDMEGGWIQTADHNSSSNEVEVAKGKEEENEEEDLNHFKFPASAAEYPLWLLSLPWYAAFTVTVPNCKKDKWQTWYLATFTMSIVWIGGISWYMVEWAADIGCILGIPDAIMGVTVLAAGTSIPDAMSSIVVAKQGMGDMAVANAVGSNVFDIWLGLGLPWMIVIPFTGEKSDSGRFNAVKNSQLTPNVLILFGVLVMYIWVVVFCKFKLYPKVGWVFLATYVVYALYNIVFVWILDIYE
ncbi:hypothetical protein BSKO_09731 [Bryopsis sp. KO-2023]|nr:hypothetical protein BSKO_09731 [Bryopsis sp. KO-2023]